MQFKIEGPFTIAGADNANLKDRLQYTGNTRKARKGRALVKIKSTQGVGDFQLRVIVVD